MKWALVALIALPGVAWAAKKEHPGIRARGIIRAGVDRDGRVHNEILPLKFVTSITYKIMILNADGSTRQIDEEKPTLEVGQQFRLEIQAENDMFVYVFHEGPDGMRQILVPDKYDQDGPPKAKKGETVMVPNDGTYFEVVPPFGDEKLLVYATPKPVKELTPEWAFGENQERQNLIKLKTKQDAVFNKDAEKTEKVKTDSVEEFAEKVEEVPTFRLRNFRWELDSIPGEEGKTVVAGTTEDDPAKRPDLFLEIPLSSK